MSEPITTTTPPVDVPKTQGDPAVDEPLGEPGKRALTAERAARAEAERANAALTAQLAAIEKANLSELDRAKAEATEAKTALEKVTRDGLVSRVALDKGVKPTLARFLTGSTEAELIASADVLLAELGTAPTTPRPDLTQSSTRDPAAKGTPEADFAAFLKSQMG